ncbi:hypothetical protein INS49_010067 [Diaporthe citri]|uniref:uncharacterized protein n=1 Tax=Diaporthe citri TaxID=83186 RepID=UPI001C824CE4|nr:uncharacterized protein INS49_010067 [Diaporthe citri]KAG6361838.1 hypothetical protein INS49_010067 [Diaporthe citri]
MSSQQLERLEYSAEVESRWKSFKTFFDQNRAVVVNRWLAMNKQQRMDLLAANWQQSGKRDSEKNSEMPKDHRPDLMEVAPWRDNSNKYRKLLPLKTGLDENHQRWPDFNQEDLTKRDESFLTMLSYRAQEHPGQFATLDCYRDNKFIAANEGLVDLERSYFYQRGMAVVTMTGESDEGDEYGTRYFPDDEEEVIALQEAGGVWAEVPAIQAMVNQRRIYHFLQSMVLRIGFGQSYKVANETTEEKWLPESPDPQDVGTPKYETELGTYVGFLRETMHYTAMNTNLTLMVLGICYRQSNSYAARLRGLKSSPQLLYNHISDIREHSHHEIAYSLNNEKHRWAAYNNNLRNPEMVGTYLIKALHDLTEGLDAWSFAMRTCAVLAREVDKEEPDFNRYISLLVYLCNVLRTRSQLENLRTTLACSQGLRKYFRNASFDENNPIPETVGNQRLPKDNEESSLISLLKALREKDVYDAISFESDGWADEIVTLCQRKETGERWMTNFATDKAEESRDAMGAFLATKRMWEREYLARIYDPYDEEERKNYSSHSDRLRAINPMDRAFKAIVSKHMIPNPNLKFDYPDIEDDQQDAKRREHAATRKALSEDAITELNNAIPLATADNGADVALDHPPPPPETSPQDEANPPSTPPGPSGPVDPPTPTGMLAGLSVITPPRRQPPAMRTPEKKTTDDGVKKTTPPTRRRPRVVTPPRRPETDRRRERAERYRQLVEREPELPAAVPNTAPDPAGQYPKIELDSKNYELLKSLMTTDGLSRPGTVPWNDIIGIFRAIGFSTTVSGRLSRGGLQIFTPTEALRQSQGIDKPISRDRPHGPDLDFKKARKFFRGTHGFGKYPNWTFDHFKEAGT